MRTLPRGSTLLSLTLAGSVAACSGADATDVEGTPVVQLSDHFIELSVGDSLQISALPMLPPGFVPSLTWASSDPATVRVHSSGARSALVTGVGVGQAVITASGEGAADSASVTVAERPGAG